ncbi:unnamed protein product [Phytophthora lilii]|uniref:Unnamed protein product n=1 Tax=Phytophthora lilii TaxID=2077276 RepID=A0A9W6T9Q7_9STRA|nr:unnamed protein product [Phytophthora lilii]
MYTFEDNSGKSVTLRPEGTAGVEFVGSSGPSVDAEVSPMLILQAPYCCINLTQCDILKVIAMAADALDALGIKSKVVLELNSLGDNER